MIIKTILVTSLLLAALFSANPAQAETSWFDSALNFFGLGSEEAAPEKQASDAMKEASMKTDAVTSSDKASAMEKATAMATEASKMMAKDAAMSSLTGMVTEQLGVTQQQAQGGLGTLFGLAQTTLGSSEFQELSQYVPEMESLLHSAPEISESAQGISSLLGQAGKYGDALKSGSQAYAQFKSLGLDPAQIPQYIEVTNEFLKKQGGTDVATLFSKGLEALM